VARASLPKTYQGAKTALQKCVQIDECKKWKDRAQALASYAKQSQDDLLLQMSRRIYARARPMAATNKCLAQINKSRANGEATKKREKGKRTSRRLPRKAGGGRNQASTEMSDMRDIPPAPEEIVITEPARPSKFITLWIYGLSVAQWFLVPGPWYWKLLAAFATFAVLSLLRGMFWTIRGDSWP
jgi:hypothetical protein